MNLGRPKCKNFKCNFIVRTFFAWFTFNFVCQQRTENNHEQEDKTAFNNVKVLLKLFKFHFIFFCFVKC